MAELHIGVVGYNAQSFNEDLARWLLDTAYNTLAMQYPGSQFTIISGLSNFGIPKLAYEEAVKRGWRTVGVTLRYRLDRGDPLFPVDHQIIVDGQRGDESPVFLANIHALVRIGGGPQSMQETEAVKRSGRPVIEYDLPPLPSHPSRSIPAPSVKP